MYLVFDTETNGLPVNKTATMKDLYNWPRVAQLAWQVYDIAEKLVSEGSFLIQPDGWKIPTAETFERAGYSAAEAKKKAQFFIDNNMSTERCIQEGVPIRGVLEKFVEAYKQCRFMIAHNMEFDFNVLGAEMLRYGITTGSGAKCTRICTMRTSTAFCRITRPKTSGFKPPRLEELYKRLFNLEIKDAHDAKGDVFSAAQCFFELKRRGIIIIQW